MRIRIDWTAASSLPGAADVLRSQGLPVAPDTPRRIAQLLQDAMETYLDLAQPRGVIQVVTPSAFAEIYRGEGLNLPEAPLDHIVPRAEVLAPFVATVGEGLSDAISQIFAHRDPARGYMLDAVASEAADRLAVAAGGALVEALRRSGSMHAPTSVLPYSPGYCGWDITGQRALFAAVAPDDIGVTLNATCLMHPLKSVSGVLVVGSPEAHAFRPEFACCDACSTRQCEQRLAMLQVQ
jgi:hypothetical protein